MVDKFRDPKTGKVVLEIDDENRVKKDHQYFEDKKKLKDAAGGTVGTTSADGAILHAHGYEVDEEGDGETAEVNDHEHVIAKFVVTLGGDGHTHTIQAQ